MEWSGKSWEPSFNSASEFNSAHYARIFVMPVFGIDTEFIVALKLGHTQRFWQTCMAKHPAKQSVTLLHLSIIEARQDYWRNSDPFLTGVQVLLKYAVR